MARLKIKSKHRIICGDSTDAATIDRLLDGERPHLMVTDPPYGVNYDPEWRAAVAQSRGIVAGMATGKVLNDHQADWREAWSLFAGDVAYVWHSGLHSSVVVESLEVCDFRVRSQIIWVKSKLVFSRGDYHWQHEPCWYAVKNGANGHWSGDRKQTTIWEIDTPSKNDTGHGTQKPVECMKRPIENNSKPGDVVYEPFSGSGTTIIAGEMTGRRVFACELNPPYVDMAVDRWQRFAGGIVVLDGTGQTFDEVRVDRIAA